MDVLMSVEASIVICTHNRAENLRRALTSVKEAQEAQEAQEAYALESLRWEVIVVDNNSEDHTRSIVEEFKSGSNLNVVYVFERREGLSYARNRGVSEAKGEV